MNCSVILNYNYFQSLSVPVPIVITLCGTCSSSISSELKQSFQPRHTTLVRVRTIQFLCQIFARLCISLCIFYFILFQKKYHGQPFNSLSIYRNRHNSMQNPYGGFYDGMQLWQRIQQETTPLYKFFGPREGRLFKFKIVFNKLKTIAYMYMHIDFQFLFLYNICLSVIPFCVYMYLNWYVLIYILYLVKQVEDSYIVTGGVICL